MADKNEWGSNLSFILAMIGSAVGLGNIWRYPYVLYSNGGGAFYIPYIVAIILMGIPFLILEYGVGYNYKSSFAKAIKKINSKFEYLGWFLPVSVFLIMIYYSAILGWDGVYVILSLFKGWGADPNLFFTTTLLQSTDSYLGLAHFVPVIAIAMLLSWAIIWFISHRDLEKGLGRVSKVLVPLLFVIMLVIIGISLSLPGAKIGLEVLFSPNWSTLYDPGIWMAAFGQIVFSLSLGMSIAFTYASYTKDETDLITNTITVAFANCFFENIAALGVFSILGYMSLNSGVAVQELVSQGTGLVFIVYPTVFNVLGHWAYVLGPLFFFAVYLAGITSILSTIEPLSFSIQNKFDLSRNKTMTILCIVGASISMLYATAFGAELLGYVDTFINQVAILLGVIIECIVFAWIFKAEKLLDFLNNNSKSIKLGKWWLIIVKFVLPIIVSIVWISGLVDLVRGGTSSQLFFTIATALLLIISTLVFTLLPAKNPKWSESDERV